jgi:hypothetical protein
MNFLLLEEMSVGEKTADVAPISRIGVRQMLSGGAYPLVGVASRSNSSEWRAVMVGLLVGLFVKSSSKELTLAQTRSSRSLRLQYLLSF